ncbi:hypothetical protein [Flavobacterium gelatinilyticum]|uniref:hypothetical protein n=1 Tax=Flavobacterium gelatinilyticum TaxID=3003260 RepID=UPI0024809BCF|nr:hypothetical protein [Flavobacterium gelatinilyticum]
MKSKYLKVFGLLLLTIVIVSFSVTKKQQDSKLIGIWKGFEKDSQIEGVEKHWIQQRFKDGTYVIMFTAKENCEVETFTENGKWWTENGKFFEVSNSSQGTDEYIYDVKSEEEVEFKSLKLNGKNDNTYTFSDYRIDLK